MPGHDGEAVAEIPTTATVPAALHRAEPAPSDGGASGYRVGP
jgi:hypothetical protein